MKKIINIILTVLWMAIIFIMSSFDSVDSGNQSNFIVDILTDIFNINDIEVLSLIIRKLAHFTEYFILGLLVCNLIRCYDKKVYVAVIICILYAISDEIHQYFVPGRSCQMVDIIIDGLGALLGIFLISIYNLKHK